MRHKSRLSRRCLDDRRGQPRRQLRDRALVASCPTRILKDFALTNKLLKLVNTAFYGQFSGTISTVSRAVVILGFENVRQVAVTLALFEHLQNKSQALQLREEILASYFTGLLGRELVSEAGMHDGEEAFICALFHSLGRLVTAYYLHEEFQEICRLQRAQGLDEARASAQVLGLSFEDLGIGVGAAWHFPERLLHSMRRVTDEKVRRPTNTDERLRALAELAAGLCASLREPEPARRRSASKRWPRATSPGHPTGVARRGRAARGAELVRDTALFGIAPTSSELVARLAAACQAVKREQAPAMLRFPQPARIWPRHAQQRTRRPSKPQCRAQRDPERRHPGHHQQPGRGLRAQRHPAHDPGNHVSGHRLHSGAAVRARSGEQLTEGALRLRCRTSIRSSGAASRCRWRRAPTRFTSRSATAPTCFIEDVDCRALPRSHPAIGTAD